MSEVKSYDSEERRSPARLKDGHLSQEQELALIAQVRFGGRRPETLAYPDERFTGEGHDSTAASAKGIEIRHNLTCFLDHLEGKLDAEAIERLQQSFEASLAPWEEAGLFSEEREARGHRRPDFKTDYLPLFGAEDLAMMEEGAELDRGYGRAVWTPEDVPVASDNPETLTLLKLAEEALRKAVAGTAGGKAPNTLLVGPDKRVLTADQIDLKQILWQWERYKKPGIVYNPKKLDPKKHGGQSEAEMLASLRGTEKSTGGVLRLERDQLITPKDVGQAAMRGRDWHAMIKAGTTLPSNVRAQDAKQALAYIIHCLNTEGWIPDYYDWQDSANSQVALAPETYIPDESRAGAVPAFFWYTRDRRFRAGRNFADSRNAYDGVRGGVRKNNVTA